MNVFVVNTKNEIQGVVLWKMWSWSNFIKSKKTQNGTVIDLVSPLLIFGWFHHYKIGTLLGVKWRFRKSIIYEAYIAKWSRWGLLW